VILVDTSVFIDYLKDVHNEKTEKFTAALRQGVPFGICPCIYQELLQGCLTEKDFRLLKRYLDTQRMFDVKGGLESYAKAGRIYFDLRKKGKSLRSTLDCLIAQTAIENGLQLLHNDVDFDLIPLVAPLRIY